jgi:DNA ligase-1
VERYHNLYVSDGYEGIILRNFLGSYEQKNRSKNLQKFKKFMDSEFKIVDFTEGTGTEKGLIIFECITSDGSKFRVRPSMSFEERAKMFKKGKIYIGKMLTVKYFEMTDSDIPRFPVGLCVRDYE